MNVFVFDIETVPDVNSGRRLYGDLEEMRQLSDKDVARVMYHHRQQQTGKEDSLLKHNMHKIVAISGVFRFKGSYKGQEKDTLEIISLGEETASEAELVRQFFSAINKYSFASPQLTLASWNGGGFDLPVLHYRALLHGINAQQYWKINYPYRYGKTHIDLMDILANYQMSAVAKLDDIAKMLGFPGKLGIDGSQVWETYLNNDITAIRHYCETDVLNTYLVYLRFELMRGHLNQTDYDQECDRLRQTLKTGKKAHFNEFLTAWDKEQQDRERLS